MENITLYEYFEPIRNIKENTFETLNESFIISKKREKNNKLRKLIIQQGIDIKPLEKEVLEKSKIIVKEYKDKDIKNKSLIGDIKNSIIEMIDNVINKSADYLNKKIKKDLFKGILLGITFLLFKISIEFIFSFFLGPAVGISICTIILEPFLNMIFGCIADETNSTGVYTVVSNIDIAFNFKKLLKELNSKIVTIAITISNFLNKLDTNLGYKKDKEESSKDRTSRAVGSLIVQLIFSCAMESFTRVFKNIMKIKKD